MKFTLITDRPQKKKEICLIIPVFADGSLTASGKEIDAEVHHGLTNLLKQKIFIAKISQNLPLFNLGPFAQILLVGCGNKEKFNAPALKKVVISAIKTLNLLNIKKAINYLTEIPMKGKSTAWQVKQTTEAVYEGFYRYDLFKSQQEPPQSLAEFHFALADAKEVKDCSEALAQGKAIAKGIVLTKNLANAPSNVCTPSFLAEQAKTLAKEYSSLSVKVLHEKEMHKLGMNALLAVGQGSAEESKLICLEYRGGKKNGAPIALIGKGITFDSGGNSIKPADSMVGMKYDMCGAATVLGVLRAVAELKLPLNLVGLIPTAENMPGGSAFKPEDILTSLSGQTIEIISTDAEGRLVLADALTYAERYKPSIVIDIATLTGAVVIALGLHASALLSNDEALATELLAAGEECYDRAWQLPLWDEYQEQIKSPFADLANIGGRSGGAITAACFLSRFAKKFRWAHLDVAGTAAVMAGISDRIATGRPVPMLMQYLLNQVK